MNPDSFLCLLDDNMRSMVQRRLEAHDLDAVEIYMTKLANEEAKTVYLEWKVSVSQSYKVSVHSGLQFLSELCSKVCKRSNRYTTKSPSMIHFSRIRNVTKSEGGFYNQTK